MRRGVIAAVAAGFVVVVLIAWFALIAPQNKDISSTKAKVSSADKQTEQLQAELQHLQELSAKAPQQQAELQKLNAAIPTNPDLANFIEQANTLADQSGIDWLSITPGVPAASTASGGPTTIALNIQLSGSFYQTLAYLDSLESLSRLVIISNVSISAAGSGATGSSGSSSSPTSGSATATSGSPQGELTVTLTGQMYTQASPPAANGATGTTPAPGGSTSTTTAPSGSSSTTAPSTSSSGSSAVGPVGRVRAGGRA